MGHQTAAKVFKQWVLLFAAAVASAALIQALHLRADFLLAILAIAGITAAFAAGAEATTRFHNRRTERCIQELEQFAMALPTHQIVLQDTGPPELQILTRAMKGMAERIQHVVELAQVESARREAILAAMAEGVLAVDSDLRVVFCNDAFAQAFQARMPLPQGRTLYEVVREPVLRDILQRVARTGVPERDRFQLPTAGSRWFEARALQLVSNPRSGALVVLHDVTDLQAQEQLRKDFVADVSHELRTPLTAIRGYAETLLDGALNDGANNRRFVEIIMSHAIRLNNIASDLLVLSDLDSQAQLQFPLEPVFVPDVVQSVIYSVAGAAEKQAVRLQWDDVRPCFVQGVRFRLEQALGNLLDNAVKFNREGGEVVVRCFETDDRHVCISVTDTGVGIPSADLKKVFERFYRVDKARSRPTGGTGLGLPIVKEIVERMGGSVVVSSQLGRGTRFELTLQRGLPSNVEVPELGTDTHLRFIDS